MSGVFWLATSDRERQQARELVNALRQTESRDELGIGSVRDALADLLLPGTSTLHTRARYHLLIPWAYERAVDRGGSRALTLRVRDAEAELIATLKESGASASDADLDGLIGRDAGRDLKRMPSALYWQGLRVWGVRRVGGPQSAVHRLLERSPRRGTRDDEGDLLDGGLGGIWHPNLPEPPEDHPHGADFRLAFAEAQFLAERLEFEPATRGSALAQLVKRDAGHRAIHTLWSHPETGHLTQDVQAAIEQARRFSLLMHGAMWVYNVILAHMVGVQDLEDLHREEFERWARTAGDPRLEWALDELWATTRDRVPPPTRSFVHRWQQLLVRRGPEALVDEPEARALIVDRERKMKRANARTVNTKALAQWGGHSGTAPLDYRWSTARTLLADIRDGLEGA